MYSDYVETSNVDGVKLLTTGETPQFGNIVVSKEGKICISLHNGEFCALKDFDENEITITEDTIDNCIEVMYLPRINLVGDSLVYVEINTTYIDDYVEAFTFDGTPTLDIETKIYYDENLVDEVDVTKTGEYTIIYTVTEEEYSASAIRTVIVRDTFPPILTTPGDVTLRTNEVLGFDLMSGVSVTDNSGASLPISVTGSLSLIPNTYIITYSATDTSGNVGTTTRAISVIDLSAPVLTLLGSNPLNIFVGGTYTEAGATALDDVDGDLTSSISVTGSINSNVKGTQYIIYRVTDNSGNESSLARTVNVIDNVPPTITFTPNGNSTYAKARTIAVSASDVHILISTTRYLWIKVLDAASNENIIRTNVFQLDNTNATVAFGTNGNVTYGTSRNTTVTVGDVHSGVSTLHYQWTTSSTAPTSASFTTTFISGGTITTPAGVTGRYYLWVKIVDNAGNELILGSNVFNLDNTRPVITLLGSATLNHGMSSAYVDAGATTSDNINGNITASIVMTGSVNTGTPGTYILTYNVSDALGNAATPVTRTVTVFNDLAPTITYGMNGNATYARTRSTTVSVTLGFGTISSLNYLWTTSTTAPAATSITTPFTNGASVPSPAGVTGTYYLWIKVIDSSANQTIVRTNAFNLDNTPPVVTLNGASSVSLNLGGTYTELGATASDAISGAATVTTSGTVNVNSATTYTITYSATDAYGNVGTRTRSVVVNPITQYRYSDSYESCSTCYNSCPESQSATPNYSCSTGSLSGTTCTTSASSNYSCSVGSLSGSTCWASATATYTCSSGTLSGSTCTTSATSSYSCSVGSLSGTTCYTTRPSSQTCPSGRVLVGGTCRLYMRANPCPGGYYDSGGGECVSTSAGTTPTTTYGSCSSGWTASGSSCTRAASGPTYSCSTGWTVSGSNCTKAASGPSYSCSSGWTLSGANCSRAASGPTYSCSSGWTVSGSSCTRSATISSYSCPSGWSVSGSNCTRSVQCEPHDCNCSTQWGGWSGWTTTYIASSPTRQVQTQLKYTLP